MKVRVPNLVKFHLEAFTPQIHFTNNQISQATNKKSSEEELVQEK